MPRNATTPTTTTHAPDLGDSGRPLDPIGPSPDAPTGHTMRDVAAMNAGGQPYADFRRLSVDLDFKIRMGLSSRPPRGEYPVDTPLGRATRLHAAYVVQLGNFAREAASVIDDEDLTPIGRQKKIAEVGQKYLRKGHDLVNSESILPSARRTKQRADERIREAVALPDPADVGAAMLGGEIRSILRSMDASARIAAWEKIVRTKDAAAIAAVLNGPAFDPILPPNLIDEGVRLVSEALDPEAFAMRQDADAAILHMEGMAEEYRGLVAQVCGIDLRPKRPGLADAPTAPTDAATGGEAA